MFVVVTKSLLDVKVRDGFGALPEAVEAVSDVVLKNQRTGTGPSHSSLYLLVDLAVDYDRGAGEG